jgi:Putative porin
MLKPIHLASAVAAALALGAVPATHADENDVLLKVLVRKGILTQDEAAAVKAEVAKEKAKEAKIAAKSAPVSTSDDGMMSKLDISKSIDKLKLYGDLRLRYQYDDKDPQLFTPNRPDNRDPSGAQTSRWRFRLRVGAEITLTDQWSGGFELSTQQASDSGNQTYENGFDDYNIYISKAYLRWDPNKAFTFVGGKMTNPFYTTDLVWDADITPNGIAEIIRFDQLFGVEPEAEAGLSKDGKTVVSKAVKSERNWELSLVAGQFLFDDNNENNFDNDESTDAYLFQTQLVGSYKFEGGTKLTVAPGWLVENAGSVTGATNNNPFNDNANVSGATRNINLLLFPGDVSFKLGDLKAKFYWDFSYNIEGRKRTEDIYNLVSLQNGSGESSDDDVTDPDDFDKGHSPQDNFAYLVGIQLGENKKSGDWSIRADWRQTGIAAVDPNLNDSDFAVGELNTRGIRLGLAYNFTDFAIGAVTYYHAWNIRDNLIGGEATGGNAIGDANTVRGLQVDLTLKF